MLRGAAWDGRPLPVDPDAPPATGDRDPQRPSRVATALAQAGVPMGSATPVGVDPIPVKIPRRRRERRPRERTWSPTTVDLAVRGTRLLAAAGPVLAVFALAISMFAVIATRNPATATGPAAAGQGPAGFAQMFVATWLQAGDGDESTLQAFYPGQVDLSGRPSDKLTALRAAAQTTTELAPSYWHVVVAAEIREWPATGGKGIDRGLHYYQVGVLANAGGYVAAALPAEIPAPPTPPAAATVVAADRPPALDIDVRDRAVDRFLRAMLTPPPDKSDAQAEVDRLTAPGSDIRAITPTPYTDLEIRRIGYAQLDPAGTETAARVVVAASTPSGNTLQFDYSLRLQQRDGRWEISRVAPAPAVDLPTRKEQ